jgi:hypothetical protein
MSHATPAEASRRRRAIRLKAFPFRAFRLGSAVAAGLATALLFRPSGRRRAMRHAVAQQLASIRLPLDRIAGAGVVASFFWLLFQDRIHPVVVYALELFLTL